MVAADGTSPIPDNVKSEEAAVLALSVSNAAAGLYQDGLYNLPPSPEQAQRSLAKLYFSGVAAQMWAAELFGLPLLLALT